MMGQTLAGLEPELQVQSMQKMMPKVTPLKLAPMAL